MGVEEPKVLLISPPEIIKEYYDEAMEVVFGHDAPRKQQVIQKAIIQYANSNKIFNLLASEICKPARPGDGIHLDELGNKLLGESVANKILKIL